MFPAINNEKYVQGAARTTQNVCPAMVKKDMADDGYDVARSRDELAICNQVDENRRRLAANSRYRIWLLC